VLLDFPADLPFAVADIEATLLGVSAASEVTDEPAPTSLRLLEDVNPGDATSESATRRGRILLPQPRLGRFSIRLQASWNRAAAPPDGALSAPLFVPVDGKQSPQKVTVSTGRELAATLQPPAAAFWQRTNLNAADSFAEFTAGQPEYELPLVVRSVDWNVPSSTVVERAWLQTWISGRARQDRAVFRFRTLGALAAIELPPALESTEIEILLDGQPIEATSRSAGRLVVPLGQESRAESRESRARQSLGGCDVSI
jgi:hypothetical protein